jgi:hypothetical protein
LLLSQLKLLSLSPSLLTCLHTYIWREIEAERRERERLWLVRGCMNMREKKERTGEKEVGRARLLVKKVDKRAGSKQRKNKHKCFFISNKQMNRQIDKRRMMRRRRI